MELKEQLEKMKKIIVVKESLIDYAGPIFVFGNMDWILSEQNPTIISASMSKDEFVILNNRIPNWLSKVKEKSEAINNVLIITNMDKISVERQEIFLDILENNQISNEDLPENLKIILHSDNKCEINYKIRDIVECYEV